MDVQQAYDTWAEQYDSNSNKTRDLEAISLRAILAGITCNNCLEIGCGTGKNTEYLLTKASNVTAVDFSPEMLARARQKITAANVQFIQADITGDWQFGTKPYDLVVFSLVLEHIENLEDIFRKVAKVVIPNASVYVGELHPFKQYTGSKARFDTEAGEQSVTCFNHHLSDFTSAAKEAGFEVVGVEEHFDDNNKTSIPRILTLLFRKS